MSSPIELLVGQQTWSLTIPPDRSIPIASGERTVPLGSVADMTRAALEHPFGFEALRRAVTPDDRVTLVLDPTLPDVAAILAEILAHLRTAGIPPGAITILTPPNSPQTWVEELPEEFTDVQTEVHDPTEPQKVAYLATTQSGRRLYLNRTLVDADFVVVVSGRRYDPLTGYAGAEAAVYPALGNEELRTPLPDQLSVKAPGTEPWPVRLEAAETLWLLGTPFLVQAIAGDGDTIQEVIGGLPDSSAEGIRRQDARWRFTVPEQPDVAVVAVSGNPARLSFLDLAKAAACAARVVKKGGRIAVLSSVAPDLGDGARLLRSMDGPTGAKKLLARLQPADWAACLLWAYAARNRSLFLASGYPDNVAEELFATPIHTAAEVQRLIDSGGRVLLVPEAHKAMIEVRE